MSIDNLTLGQKYDLEHCSRKEDIDFWLEAAQLYGSPIIDIGCGTGRVSIPLATAGYKVYGIDKAAFMLERFEEKIAALPERVKRNVKNIEGDMRTFDLGIKVPLVICTFNTFLNMLTSQDRKQFLGNVSAHLKQGGRLILDTSCPNKGNLKPSAKWCLEKTNVLPDGPISKRFYRHISHDKKNKILRIEFHTILFDKNGSQLAEWFFNYTTAYLKCEEILDLLGASGFVIEECFDDYSKSPYASTSNPEVCVVVGRKN